MIEVHVLKALQDNYIYVLRESSSQKVVVIDPSDANPIMQFLEQKNWPLHMILNTHHHHDHVGGNEELKTKYGCEIYCSQYDSKRIPGATRALQRDEDLTLGESSFQIINVPGHTLGAIAFYSSKDQLVFTGDTLFTLGCGRLFEGTARQLYESLKILAKLPGDTKVYSGHEYGLQNAAFALAQNPQSTEIKEFYLNLRKLLPASGSSVPSTIAQENRLNPFLNAASPEAFTKLRRLKDDFRLENADRLG